jgi:hypothetical protein
MTMVGEVAERSQAVGEASDSSSRSGDVDLCGGVVLSYSGGAPRRGSMAVAIAGSRKGKKVG